MKLKTYFLTLLLFLFFFYGSILILSLVNTNSNLNNIRERVLGEHYFISASFAKDIKAVEGRGNSADSAIDSIFKSYSGYYQKENVYLELCIKDKLLFTSMSGSKPNDFKMQHVEKGNRTVSTVNTDGKKYISVTGSLPSPYADYTLIYYYDISQNIASLNKVTGTLFVVGIIISFVLALCLILILNYIFKPLKQISLASQSIAKGEYENRIPVKGRDELSEMAQSFNNMAEEIQCQMAQLLKSSEQKQNFVDNFAHELRTPLTTIYGYAEYIQKASISEEEKLSATGYIMSETQRLQNMAYRLLDLATLRSNEIEFTEVKVSELFNGTIQELRNKASDKQVTLVFDHKYDLITGDYELLKCLVINLAENGIKACKQGGIVQLRAYLEDGKKVIAVEDNGTGIAEEHLEHITEAFYRVDKSRSRAEGGVGLGLSLCKQIASRHNAELFFTSRTDFGTTVKIIFTTL